MNEFDVKYYNKRAKGIVSRLDKQLLAQAIVMLSTKGGIFEYFLNGQQEVSDLRIIKAIYQGATKTYGTDKKEVHLIANPTIIEDLAKQVPEEEFTSSSLTKVHIDTKAIAKKQVVELLQVGIQPTIISNMAFIKSELTEAEVEAIANEYNNGTVEVSDESVESVENVIVNEDDSVVSEETDTSVDTDVLGF